VLSLTNVSLLPLELLAAGCIPVMNSGDNNTMVLGQNDYIAYSDPSPAALADALSALVKAPAATQQARAKAASASVKGRSWQSALDTVRQTLEKEIYE
jgi:glycosyltransferase involved in cell wall biosynthesis